MIGFLRGRLLEKQPSRITLDVNGVGYDVVVPLSTYYRLGEEGADVALKIHTHVREDALQLFGFFTDLERQLFERLISISGIGPKMGVALLSGMEPRDLLASVQRGDVGRLTGIPGIGKKTAERIVLELKDRVAQLGVPPETGVTADLPANRLRDDLVSALLNLGYHRPLAEKAVDAACAADPGATFEVALKASLRELMRGR